MSSIMQVQGRIHVVGMIEIINVIVTPTVKLESFGYSFNNW